MSRGSRRSRSSRPVAGPSSSRRSRSRRSERAESSRTGFCLRRGQGPLDRGAAVRPDVDHQRGARSYVEQWRALPNPSEWQVTPETARLLQHWRHHEFSGVRPFFCQVEAVETAIWLTEVAPQSTERQAVPRPPRARERGRQPRSCMRLALKLATGAGKTTVMAMLIAWQTDQRRPPPGQQALHARLSRRRARPHDQGPPARPPAERSRQLLREPRARPERHARRRRPGQDRHHQLPRLQAARADRAVEGRPRSCCKGRTGDELNTLETEGQMLQRVMPDLMGMKNILVLNDEAHHCYREKPEEPTTTRT